VSVVAVLLPFHFLELDGYLTFKTSEATYVPSEAEEDGLECGWTTGQSNVAVGVGLTRAHLDYYQDGATLSYSKVFHLPPTLRRFSTCCHVLCSSPHLDGSFLGIRLF
jgi:hypothetical protein